MSRVAVIPAVHVLSAPAMLKHHELCLHLIRHDSGNVFYMPISSDCRHATHDIYGGICDAFCRDEHGKLKNSSTGTGQSRYFDSVVDRHLDWLTALTNHYQM